MGRLKGESKRSQRGVTGSQTEVKEEPSLGVKMESREATQELLSQVGSKRG